MAANVATIAFLAIFAALIPITFIYLLILVFGLGRFFCGQVIVLLLGVSLLLITPNVSEWSRPWLTFLLSFEGANFLVGVLVFPALLIGNGVDAARELLSDIPDENV
jgi:hypothetical protein